MRIVYLTVLFALALSLPTDVDAQASSLQRRVSQGVQDHDGPGVPLNALRNQRVIGAVRTAPRPVRTNHGEPEVPVRRTTPQPDDDNVNPTVPAKLPRPAQAQLNAVQKARDEASAKLYRARNEKEKYTNSIEKGNAWSNLSESQRLERREKQRYHERMVQDAEAEYNQAKQNLVEAEKRLKPQIEAENIAQQQVNKKAWTYKDRITDRLDEASVAKYMNPLYQARNRLNSANQQMKSIVERQQALNTQRASDTRNQRGEELFVRQKMIDEDRTKIQKEIDQQKAIMAPLEQGLEKEIQRIAREENADVNVVRQVAREAGISDNLGWFGSKFRGLKRAIGMPVIKPPEAELDDAAHGASQSKRKNRVRVTVEVDI